MNIIILSINMPGFMCLILYLNPMPAAYVIHESQTQCSWVTGHQQTRPALGKVCLWVIWSRVGGWSISAFADVGVSSWTRTFHLFNQCILLMWGWKPGSGKMIWYIMKKVISSVALWICRTNNVFFKVYSKDKSETFYQYLHQKLNRLFFLICLIFTFFLHTAIWHSCWRGWKPDEWRSKTEDSYCSSSSAKPQNPAPGYGYVSTG